MYMELYLSNKKNKRYVIVFNNKKYHFGQSGSHTYIDGATDLERDNYRKRHYANKTEKYNIDNLIHSPSLFAYYILWGESHDIHKNLKSLNKRMNH